MRIFIEHGTQVDPESRKVCLPPGLVLKAMSHAPRVYTLSGRAEGTSLTLDDPASHFSTDGVAQRSSALLQRVSSVKQDRCSSDGTFGRLSLINLFPSGRRRKALRWLALLKLSARWY